MNNATILDRGISHDLDPSPITSQHGTWPNGGKSSNGYFADQHSILMNKGIRVDLGAKIS
jgi:hypothetical protein